MNTGAAVKHGRDKLSVLHIITNLPVGGAQDNTLLTVELLDRSKYDVALMSAAEGDWVERARAVDDLELIFSSRLVRPISLFKDLAALWRIYRLLKQRRFDIVHTHSSKPGFLGRVAAKLAGVPIIIHTIHGFPFHDFMNPFKRTLYIVLERVLAHISDQLLTVCKLNLEKAVSLRLAPRRKFANVYSGIDFSKFDIQIDLKKKRRELGLVNGECIVGMIGRLSAQKAPLDFVRAIPVILRSRQDVQFLLVGDGELRESTEKLSRELGLGDKLKILGFRHDIPEILPLLDVFVLTSYWEGLGRSLTEAMYTGRPVVATRVEGVPELVENGKTGILVEPQDIEGISRGVLNLLEDRETAHRLGQAAASRISSQFRADIMVGEIEKIYDRLAQQRLKR